jgi:hypothetical protein
MTDMIEINADVIDDLANHLDEANKAAGAGGRPRYASPGRCPGR